ncbi:unnamed protein product [Cylindrotheca closterium]|uniref:Uncharacterized protein n=1 Tax=Cylindrotheca closterium TaxID=2856 RepID=A0AAD2G843_9STRA|nr:unnamed protein product [Cylindrotheca closterium]
MSLDYKKGFTAFIGIGCAAPALALVAGFPDAICSGLGVPHEQWTKSKEALMGLYLYTISDIALGALCGAALMEKTSTALALGAAAVHQVSYVSAATAVYGFRKEHVASVITAAIATALALKE